MAALGRLLVAILAGLLIGVDRKRAEVHKLFAGVRTFPSVALAGDVPMLLHDVVDLARPVASFVAVAAAGAFSEAQARPRLVYLRQMTPAATDRGGCCT
jgi:uncharacterized membrane protein YhiD involved in acid resistance